MLPSAAIALNPLMGTRYAGDVLPLAALLPMRPSRRLHVAVIAGLSRASPPAWRARVGQRVMDGNATSIGRRTITCRAVACVRFRTLAEHRYELLFANDPFRGVGVSCGRLVKPSFHAVHFAGAISAHGLSSKNQLGHSVLDIRTGDNYVLVDVADLLAQPLHQLEAVAQRHLQHEPQSGIIG